MDEIQPFKNLVIWFLSPPTIAGLIAYWIKMRSNNRQREEENRRREEKEKKIFNDNAFSEIKEKLDYQNKHLTKIEIKQGGMMPRDDADEKFIDKSMFDLHTKNIDKLDTKIDSIDTKFTSKFDHLDQTITNKITEAKNDIKDFILHAIRKDK